MQIVGAKFLQILQQLSFFSGAGTRVILYGVGDNDAPSLDGAFFVLKLSVATPPVPWCGAARARRFLRRTRSFCFVLRLVLVHADVLFPSLWSTEEQAAQPTLEERESVTHSAKS